MTPNRFCGFSLIEVMIVVAIIGILAAIAYPSYQDQVRRGNRADAKAALLETAQFMERFYTQNNRYNLDLNGAAPTLPYTKSPRDGSSTFYLIRFNGNATATTFSIEAAPQGSQTQDTCGTLRIDQSGQKTTTAGVATDCWAR